MKTRITKFLTAAIVLAGLAIPVVAQTSGGELKLPAYKKAKLKNGMTLLLMEQHEVPLVRVRVHRRVRERCRYHLSAAPRSPAR